MKSQNKKCIYLASSWFGVLALDKDGNLLRFVPINYKNLEKIVKMENSYIEEEKELMFEFGKKGYEIVVERGPFPLASDFASDSESKGKEPSVKITVESPNKAGLYLRSNALELASQYHGFNKEQFLKENREICYHFSRMKLKNEDVTDKVIIHMVEMINDLNSAINLLMVRLREFYSMYYPEMVKNKENEEILKYVLEKLYRKSEESVGVDLEDETLKDIKKLAEEIKRLIELKEYYEKRLERLTKKVMPNTSFIIGPVLAAQLLSIAGSFDKLAKFPSSTIQVLGAEKALFRYLSGRGKAPKHGIIFLSKYIQECPQKYRGKMARKLASKLNMALKVDYFDEGEKFIADKLKEDLDKELKYLKNLAKSK